MKVLLSLVCLLLGLPVYAVNLLQNASFELGTAYYGRAEGGNMDYPLLGFSLTNSPVHTGGFSMIQRNQTVGGNCWSTFPIRLKSSTSYCFSLYGQSAAAGEHVRILIVNARDDGWSGIAHNGTYVAGSDLGGINGPAWTNTVTALNTWTRYWTNWTTPASSNTAYYIRFEPITFGGIEYFIDDMQLEEVASVFTQPTDYAPCADVETAIVFPDNRGANIFWTNETCSVPIITYNWSGSAVSATNVWAMHNYMFELQQSNSFSQTIGAGVKATNTLDLTPTTNILGTYRVSTWVKGYDAPTLAENTFGIIKRPVVIPYPSTNSHFGSMIAFERFWLTNAYNIGFKWVRTLSVGRTNSLLAGQFLRVRTKTTGSSAGNTELQYADGSPAWLSNGVGAYLGFNSSNGIAAGLALATNSGFTILGTFEWLRDGASVVEGMTHVVNTTDYTNFTMWPSNFYRFARAAGLSYSPWIKYWEMGNEFDTEGSVGFGTGGPNPPFGDCCGQAAVDYASMVVSNGMNALGSNFAGAIMIPINAFQPDTFIRMSTNLGGSASTFFASKILSSHVYGAGEFGAERLYTNVSIPFGVNQHWQTESGTTGKSERQNEPQEEIAAGIPGAAGTHGNEGSDPVQRSAEIWRNYVMWSKWPTHDKWFWHLIDEKRSVSDPQSHSLFDWDGSITMRGVCVSAMAQLLEGSFGRSNLFNNAVPTLSTPGLPFGVDGGNFARGTTNCPIVIFWGTNDMFCYRAHIKLATNLFNLYDMYGNQQARATNIVFSNQPWIVEGQPGVLSNTIWQGVFIEATNADPYPPKVIFTKHPTKPAMTNDVISWRWAARDNLIAQFPQGGGAASGGLGGQASACTNLMQYRYLLAGYDAGFSAWRQDPTNEYTPRAFTVLYTNVPAGTYTMHVQAADRTGNIGSNSFGLTVLGAVIPPPPPIGPTGSRVRIGITP